jgi:hypothetical protein
MLKPFAFPQASGVRVRQAQRHSRKESQMAEAKDCVHAVALRASRQTIVAVRESLDTKTTDAKVFDTIRQVDSFYELCLADIKREQEQGFRCSSCSLEPLSSEFSFEVWTRNVTVQAIEWALEIMQESA